jgi:hypothetical protein
VCRLIRNAIVLARFFARPLQVRARFWVLLILEGKVKRITKAELKKALTKAVAQRENQLSGLRTNDAQRARLQRSRLASEKLLSKFLTGAGLDLKKLRKAQGQHSALREGLFERQKNAALRFAARNKGRHQANIQKQRNAWLALASQSDIFPNPTFTLDTPFLIWSTPFFLLSDSAAMPFGSWAKFNYETSQPSGEERVSFYFLWESPFTNYAVINAATSFSATGYLEAYAPWSFWDNQSVVNASAEFSVWIGFPNGSPPTATTECFLDAIGALGQATTGSDTEGSSVSSGLSMSNTMVAIPPRATVFFEVALVLDYEVDDGGGHIRADFNSGDFEIACPVVVYSILNMPPKKANPLRT